MKTTLLSSFCLLPTRGYKQIIRKTFLPYQFQKLIPNSKQFAVLMTAIRLPRNKAPLLARVGRNALHPDVHPDVTTVVLLVIL